MVISEADAEEYVYVNLVTSLFFSAYVTSLYLLYQARVGGPWNNDGSLKRLITGNEISSKVKPTALVIGDNSEVYGAVYIILTAVAAIWLYGVAQRAAAATIVLIFLSKQIFFCTSLLEVNLSFLSSQGWSITRLPVYSARQTDQVIVPVVPDATHGGIAAAIAGTYGISAWCVMWLLSGEVLCTGRAAALLNLSGDPLVTFGYPGTATRLLAHAFELLVFVVLAERLGRMLCAVELLRLVLKQRSDSLATAGSDPLARADALLLSNRRLETLNALFAFSAISPPLLLISVLFTDILNLTGHTFLSWLVTFGAELTAVWLVGMSMSLIFLRVAITACRCGGVQVKIPQSTWKFKVGEPYVAAVSALCFVSAAVRVIATCN